MGSCQGRVCGSAVEALTGWAVGDVRAPVSPVATRALADLLATPGSASTMAP
jgi:hypothetical protein